MVSVIGAGAWGSAIFYAISQKIETVITSRRKRNIEKFVSLEKALKNEYIIIAIASQSIKDFLETNKEKIKDKKILIASKGIDNKTNKFLNEIFEEYVDRNNLAFLSGPSFAKEVKENKPTALVIASQNEKLADKFSTFFPKFIKIYKSNDVIGVEVAGAYKNVIAIASGICEGLNLGNNAKAALIARGLVEMDRFGEFFGASKDTFLGVAGAGDLFLTANSTMSRNYRVGLNLAKGKTLDDILKELKEVAEGVYTTKAIYNIATKKGIYTPIANEVYKIIYERKKVKDSLRDLLS
ncbi:NAD(P)H-dependent glycerol-3-phosphate dehydrogenase [Caminibacter mediatlanticus TB-2]|uniref:Glycerol-3-phosphate dehydrogenase [NAD(P)+] n=1 Tax=Caminibacter mediatlanticus TB-2 TaxID=391592 RepID=A0ABX5VBN7_9BACT|nr:NAD(P)H-dependent glycerol-3-phosphate dehydrogenase [Caminibacter mediatlanticus]QCT94977.1 NAD(P)H-dependent glycerol-3-phosphate dehydrogenase [Caminibacter mediatlanticus TB-2]